MRNNKHDTYNFDFECFANDYETDFVPNVLDGLLGNNAFMSDSIHHNDIGYRKVGDKIESVLSKMLK